MKVLMVSCEGLGKGGVQSIIMGIVEYLPNIDFDILLFTKEKRFYDSKFLNNGGEIFRIPSYDGNFSFFKKLDYYFRFLRIFLGVYKILKTNGPYSVIHCHNELESGICNIAAKLAGVKIRISHAHTSYEKVTGRIYIFKKYKSLLRYITDKYSNIKIACSKDAYISTFGEKENFKKEDYIMGNFINLKKTFNNKVLEKENNNFIVSHLGRYSVNKNQSLLLEIISKLQTKIPNIELRLIGYGNEYKDFLIKKSKKLNIESKVKFISGESKSNVFSELSNSDIFIFPSITEGFGISVLEAQALKIPCLVSNSLPKEVNCGLCKFISLDKNVEEWSKEALNILTGNTKLKLEKQKILKYDIGNYINKILKIYRGEDL